MKSQSDVELWRISHRDDPTLEAFLVKDRGRTPEEWLLNSRGEADAKFRERVENTKSEPPILP